MRTVNIYIELYVVFIELSTSYGRDTFEAAYIPFVGCSTRIICSMIIKLEQNIKLCKINRPGN